MKIILFDSDGTINRVVNDNPNLYINPSYNFIKIETEIEDFGNYKVDVATRELIEINNIDISKFDIKKPLRKKPN